MYVVNAEGIIKEIKNLTFAHSEAKLFDIYTTKNNEDKKYYLVMVTPNLKNVTSTEVNTSLHLYYPEGSDSAPVYSFVFTQDDSTSGKYKIQTEPVFGDTELILTNLDNEDTYLPAQKVFDFVAGELPSETVMKTLHISCKSNKSGKIYDVQLTNSKLSNIDYAESTSYWNGWIQPSVGSQVGVKAVKGSIPLSSLTDALQKEVGSNKKIELTGYHLEYNITNTDNTPEPADPELPELSQMISTNTLTGRFAQQGPDASNYMMVTTDYFRVVFDFDETSTDTGSNSGSSSKPNKPSKPAAPSVSGTSKQSYRLYNPATGEHFFTTNKAEHDLLANGGSWKSEASTWNAPEKSDFPIYRLCNPNTNDHHYTMSAGERDALVRLGWRDEGIGMYSADTDGEAVFRLYNPNAKVGSHHYTTSAAERDHLVSLGWKAEGIGFYGLK